MNRQIDNDAIRHIFIFNLLKKHINPKKICVIGDGNAKFKFYENCKWYQNYYSFRFPFFRKYEGNIKHCYVFFKK